MKIDSIEISEYEYNLPDEQIAKYPLPNRDSSKLLFYHDGVIQDKRFFDIPDLLDDNSILYFNNTKVLYARLLFRKMTGAKIEVFCLEPHLPVDYAINLSSAKSVQWKCFVGNLKKWKSGDIFLHGENRYNLRATIIERVDEAVIVEFKWDLDVSFAEILQNSGNVPIPPYLNRNSEETDKVSYQTVYSSIDGSVAAPTAGLHFTNDILSTLRNKNINLHEVTLHVGAGTFKPVSSETIGNHVMHEEFFTITKRVISSLLEPNKQVVAVGTTTVRTIESLYWIGLQLFNNQQSKVDVFFVSQWEPYNADNAISKEDSLNAILIFMNTNSLDSIEAKTQIIIVPGYKHRIVNSLITNFHQPKSTLLLLLASFVGDNWKVMYRHALQKKYRFLSYGDSCFIKMLPTSRKSFNNQIAKKS